MAVPILNLSKVSSAALNSPASSTAVLPPITRYPRIPRSISNVIVIESQYEGINLFFYICAYIIKFV